MSAAVWKHTFDDRAFHAVEMPKGAQIIHAALQGERATVWFICEPENDVETRTFTLVPTGDDVFREQNAWQQKHVGTFLFNGGALVGHLFEGPIPLSLSAVDLQKASA